MAGSEITLIGQGTIFANKKHFLLKCIYTFFKQYLFNLRLRSLNFKLNSVCHSPKWQLNVLFCCCAANKYREITGIFSKILSRSVSSTG